jgi:hypothetical protein
VTAIVPSGEKAQLNTPSVPNEGEPDLRGRYTAGKEGWVSINTGEIKGEGELSFH